MINVSVNALKIHYNESSDRFFIEFPEYKSDEVVCLENSERPCNNCDNKQKHLFAGTNTVVMAIPPDVAMSCHQIHNVTGYTLVETMRGLSQATKDKAQNIDTFINKLGELSLEKN